MKYSLIGSSVSIAGTESCVEAGDIDLGDLNLVETTCSSDKTKTYVAGTHNNATGSVTLNESTNLAAWLTAYGTGQPEDALPEPVAVVYTWPDADGTTITVSSLITNVNAPLGVDQAAKWTFKFQGVAAVSVA